MNKGIHLDLDTWIVPGDIIYSHHHSPQTNSKFQQI